MGWGRCGFCDLGFRGLGFWGLGCSHLPRHHQPCAAGAAKAPGSFSKLGSFFEGVDKGIYKSFYRVSRKVLYG